MCQQVTCRECGKASWSGCGQHIDEALRGISESQRCQGHADSAKKSSFFARLLGSKKK